MCAQPFRLTEDKEIEFEAHVEGDAEGAFGDFDGGDGSFSEGTGFVAGLDEQKRQLMALGVGGVGAADGGDAVGFFKGIGAEGDARRVLG